MKMWRALPRYLAGFGFVALLLAGSLDARAQVTTAITPTTGAGNLNTTVNQAGNTYNIGGGTRPGAGANLFHSFGEFSVGINSGVPDIANFVNDMALPTSNILGRVTGGNPSNIFGTIQTTGFGNANLFLMNPAGIVFGPTASLNVSGAVNFTTADYLRMADQVGNNAGIFYASPLQSSVLSTAPVVAFGFLTSTPAPITVQGSTLVMPAGQTLSFVAGDVTIAADPDSGVPASIQAPGGQIQIVSVASPGEVLTPSLEFGPNVNGQSFTTLGTITVRDSFSIVDVSDLNFVGDGSAGSIVLRGGRLVVDNGVLLAEHMSDLDAPSPAIKVTLDGDLEMGNLSIMAADSFALGRSGDIVVTAQNITLTNGSFFSVGSFGPGSSGDVILKASDSILFQGFVDPSNVSKIFTLGGNISIDAQSFTLDNLAAIESSSGSNGQVGNIDISVNTLSLVNGGVITVGGNAETPSRITITAQDQVTIVGAGEGFGLQSPGIFMNNVSGGGVTILTQNVTLGDGGRIEIRNDLAGQDRATLIVQATEAINLLGNGQGLDDNTFISTTGTFSPAGVIDFSGRTITLTDGSTIFSQSGADQPAGVVRLQADTITMTNKTLIGTNSANGSGAGGPIDIVAEQSFTMSSGAILQSNSFSTGPAGTVSVASGNLISVSGAGTIIQTEARSTGAGGAVSITSPTVEITDQATLSARTIAEGDAGSIEISANSVTFSGGAKADTSTSGSGAGGTVTIQGLASPADTVLIDGAGSGIFTNTAGTGPGGNIVIDGQSVGLQNQGTLSAATSGTAASASGGAISIASSQISLGTRALITAQSFGPANAGQINISTGTLAVMGGGAIDSSTTGLGQGGIVNVTASQFVSLAGASAQGAVSRFSSTSLGTGQGAAGQITVTSPQLTLSDGASLTAFASGNAAAGNMILNVGSLSLSNDAQVSSSTSGAGAGGTVTLIATGAVAIDGQGSGITTTASESGAGGAIQIQAGALQLTNNGTISASSTNTGNSGTVNIQSGGNFVMNGGTVSTSASQGQGGNIAVNAGQQVQMSNNALISSSSTGLGNAGDILVSAGDSIFLNDSAIKASADNASGGDIKLSAPNAVELVNSVISTSVQFGSSTQGGNISIDPLLVSLQNSQILAEAVDGNGGNIFIIANLFLQDGTSVVSASSQKGISGTVNIQSPISALSQVVNPLQRSTLQAAALLLERCAVRAQSGTLSTLTVRARDISPAAPGGMLSGPLLSLGPTPAASGASPAAVLESVVPKPALQEISGELLRPMGGNVQDRVGGCGS